jgi:hypothetical protein
VHPLVPTVLLGVTGLDACHGSAYEIAFGSPELIAFGSAKVIAAGSAKLIADYWTDVSVAADAAAMTAKRTDMHRLGSGSWCGCTDSTRAPGKWRVCSD